MSFPYTVQIADGAELEQSATKLHRLGTRGVTEDGRVYYYCKANATSGVARSYLACQSVNRYKVDGSQECWQGTLSAASAAGSFTLTSLDTTAAHVANFFEDGYVYLRPTSAAQQLYRVKSNTAAGTSMTVTLYEHLKYDCATAGTIMVVPSPYSNVIRVHGGGEPYAPFVCMANFAPITASYYFWGQTWGPCMATWSSGDGTGQNERNLQFNYDGSVSLMEAPAATKYSQHAGYNLMYQTDAQTNGLILIMLEIRP